MVYTYTNKKNHVFVTPKTEDGKITHAIWVHKVKRSIYEIDVYILEAVFNCQYPTNLWLAIENMYNLSSIFIKCSKGYKK